MRCYACHQLNSPNARFCIECGASLTQTPWTQSAPADAGYAPAPYSAPGGPLVNGYMPAAAMPLPGGYGAAPAPYPQGAMPAQPAMQYNQGYGYAPAAGPGGMPAQATGVQMPNGGISMVNNVTVSQATPAPAPQPQASSTSTRVVIVQRADRVGVLLRALALLIVNGFAGALWVGAADTNSYNTGSLTALALIVTILVLLFDIYVLDRLSRRP